MEFLAPSPLRRYAEQPKGVSDKARDDLSNELHLPFCWENSQTILYTLLPATTPAIWLNTGVLKGVSDLAGGQITVSVSTDPVDVEVTGIALIFSSGQQVEFNQPSQSAKGRSWFTVPNDVVERTRAFRRSE